MAAMDDEAGRKAVRAAWKAATACEAAIVYEALHARLRQVS